MAMKQLFEVYISSIYSLPSQLSIMTLLLSREKNLDGNPSDSQAALDMVEQVC
jgi:hypothetical protein